MGFLSRVAGEASLPLLPALLHPDRWLLWLGLAFVLAIYFAPQGIVGRLRPGRARKSEATARRPRAWAPSRRQQPPRSSFQAIGDPPRSSPGADDDRH